MEWLGGGMRRLHAPVSCRRQRLQLAAWNKVARAGCSGCSDCKGGFKRLHAKRCPGCKGGCSGAGCSGARTESSGCSYVSQTWRNGRAR
eukprot:109787-Pelagomonas_calceolata.AAC.3